MKHKLTLLPEIEFAANNPNCDFAIERIKDLISKVRVDVNEQGRLGTPLTFSSHEGLKRIVEILISGGADINLEAHYLSQFNGTPFHNSVLGSGPEGSGDKEIECFKIAKLLIAEGADINTVFARDLYPDAGLSHVPSITSYRGRTPLDIAIEWHDSKMEELLRKHGGKTKFELEAAGN